MHVLVEAADGENLFVVLDGLGSEEFLRFLEAAVLHACDGVRLCVQAVAVGDPAVVAAEHDNFSVVQRKGAQCVTRRPCIVLVDERHWLPLLLIQVQVTVKPLDGVQRGLVHRVAPTDDVEEATVMYSASVVVAGLVHISDLLPLVLRDVIHLALLACLVWIFAANCVDIVLRFEVELAI